MTFDLAAASSSLDRAIDDLAVIGATGLFEIPAASLCSFSIGIVIDGNGRRGKTKRL